MTLLSQKTTNYIANEIFNQSVPKEGPKSVTITIDWVDGVSQSLDLQNIQSLGFFAALQTIYIDNRDRDFPVTIWSSVTDQQLTVPAQSQAYLPILQPNPVRLVFTTPSGGNSGRTRAQLLNVPMPAIVWNAAGTFTFDSNGYLQVTDPDLIAMLTAGSGLIQANQYTFGSDSVRRPLFAADRSGLALFNAPGTSLIYSPGADLGWVATEFRAFLASECSIAAGGTITCNLQNSSGAAIFSGSMVFTPGTVYFAGTEICNFRNLQYMAANDGHNLILQMSGATLDAGHFVGLQVAYCDDTDNLLTL